MKRFISHEELARDRRFKRVRSRNTLIPNLPDNVDEVVRVFEKAAPSLRRRVEGTALEEVYDELGPAFQFLNQRGVVSQGADPNVSLRPSLHGIYVGELQALEAAGRSLWDFPDAPWGFKMNMARQCWDEARHVQIYEKLLERAGGEPGMFPETTGLFEAGCADDPVLRVTGVNRCIEGLACDAFRSLIDNAKARGDEVTEQAVDYVLADELTHVRFGSEWVREFTKGDPERAKKAKEFQMEVERGFAGAGGRRNLAQQERLEAGFTLEELKEIEEVAAKNPRGPRRETLLRAAEILRDRHQARRRGADVRALEPGESATAWQSAEAGA